MSWTEELTNLRKTRTWRDVSNFFEKKAVDEPNRAELLIEAIIFLVDLLLEGPKDGRIDFVRDADEVAAKIRIFFDNSKRKFTDNAEYLFFVGQFMSLTDWYFGDDVLNAARQMQKKAAEIEPNNILYMWGYRNSIWDISAESLRSKILADSEIMKWLKARGLAGEYIVGALETKLDRELYKAKSDDF